MLVVNRTAETLTPDERDLRDLIHAYPRTTPRPTDQRSGELKGFALESFTTPTIEEQDISFSFVICQVDRQPNPTPTNNTNTLPLKGESTMHIKHFHQGNCLLHLFTTDMALLALVLRHATSNEHLQALTPLMPTTLDSLATAFETGTLLALQQTRHVRVQGDAMLTAEQVQAWCQKVVVEGVDGLVVPSYSTDATIDSNAQATHVQE